MTSGGSCERRAPGAGCRIGCRGVRPGALIPRRKPAGNAVRVEIPPEVIRPYFASNAFGVLAILCARFWPRPARALFAVLFLAASLVNRWTALVQPGVYLTFSAIAAGQLAVGICLGVGGRLLRWGVLGGVVFLVTIAPLGFTGSAFPSTVLM